MLNSFVYIREGLQMERIVRFFEKIGFWGYVFVFTIAAIILSEILIVAQSYLLTGDFFDKNLLIVGFFTPAIDAFIVFYLSALLMRHLINAKNELNAIFDTSTDGIAILDLKSKFLKCNNAYAKMLGYSEEELLKLSCVSLTKESDIQNAIAILHEVIEKGVVEHFEKSCVKKDGSTITIKMSGVLMSDKKSILVTTQDITKDVLLREELKEEKKRAECSSHSLNEAQKIAHIGSWEFDVEQNYLRWSDEVYNIFGVNPQSFEATYEAFLSYIHPEDVEKVKSIYAHSLKTKSDYEIYHRVLRSDGGIRYVHEMGQNKLGHDGKIVKTIGIIHDVTSTQQLLDSIREQQHKYQSIMELSSDGIHLLDEDGNLYEFSDSFAQMLGYSKEEASLLNVRDWDTSIPNKSIKPMIQNLMKHQNSFETVHKRKDGSTFIAQINAKGIFINGKHYLYNSSRDVTGLRNQEKALNEKLQKIIDTQNNIVILTDGAKLKFANKTMLDFFGYKSLEEFSNHHKCVCDKFVEQENFFHIGKIQATEDNWIESLLNLSGRQRVVSMIKNDSEAHAFSVMINKYDTNDYIINFNDISDAMIEKLELVKQANIDELTNLYNRSYFGKNINQILKTNKKNEELSAIIFFDIDHFKNVNDTYGHDMGDYVLYNLAQLVKKHVRKKDVVIRWGGEEFIIICAIENPETLKRVANHLRKSVEEYKFSGVNSLTCSFGCAIHDESKTIEETIKKADEKLYDAKTNGRNRVEC